MHDCRINGLRARKRAATTLAIERAAVDLALEQGYESVTADAIAVKAGVSLRTFFNYFPTKDIAIVGRSIVMIGAQDARRLLEESRPHLLKGIARIAEASVGQMRFDPELTARRRDLIQENPLLLRRHLTAVVDLEREMARIVAAHLERYPEQRRVAGRVPAEEEALLAVTMVGSAIRYSMAHWTQEDLDVLMVTQTIERTIDLMAEIHRRDS